METTIVALATPPGAGGIAVVRLSGPESYRVTGQVFRPMNPEKKVSEAKGYTAMFGHFIARGETLDEGVALFFRAPRSYTGEDVVELSCPRRYGDRPGADHRLHCGGGGTGRAR